MSLIQRIVFFLLLISQPVFSKNCSPMSGCDITSNFQFLYWRVDKCGLDYLWPSDITRFNIDCTDDNIINTGGPVIEPEIIEGQVITLGKGKPKSVNTEFEPGFRISLEKPFCNFDLGLRYTRFCNDQSDSHNIGETPYTPSRMHPDIKGFVDRTNVTYASAKYGVDLNTFDMELYYPVTTNCGGLALVFGGKVGLIDQELNSNYEGWSLITTTDEDEFERNGPDLRIHQVRQKVCFKSGGVYLGAKGYYPLQCGLSFFGRVTYGIMHGCFNRSFREEEFTDPTNPNPLYPSQLLVDVEDSNSCLFSVSELQIGLEYLLGRFCDTEFSINFGYEFNLWNNIPGFMEFVDHYEKGAINRSDESLGFEGLFFGLTLNF